MIPPQLELQSADSGAFCKLCDIADWNNPTFAQTAARIIGPDNPAGMIRRKLWEFTQIFLALSASGVWHENSLGLSVAGGMERFLFFAANSILRIVSADIYGAGDFVDQEADEAFLLDPAKNAPYPFRSDHLKVSRMNALHLTFPDCLFDFAVLFSSIEHFGGIRQAAAALQEMARVLRPGGVLGFTTDCSLNGFTTKESFTFKQIETLAQLTGCEIVSPIDFSLSQESKKYVADMLSDDLNALPHLNLKLYASVFTSVSVVLRKPGAGSMRDFGIDERVKIIDKVVENSRNVNPMTILPTFGVLERAYFKFLQRVRGLKYRMQERLFNRPI